MQRQRPQGGVDHQRRRQARRAARQGGLFGRLVAAGKPRMAAVGACLRKRAMLCYGVLKNRAPFDPRWASRKAP
ncbi:MAG TPA: hypothetical protein VKD72_12235 [Gemmataceae bacterium]|nr:hypothetical protein [Gemmataceae bacterium]